ncbi:MAG TPA: quinolinate synthase NadA [Acidimicrobiales bacterium]|nr:quinolinate synthase NadA [Acidimicrobiales bacterium]
MNHATIREPRSPDDVRPPRRERPGIDTEATQAVLEDPEICRMSDADLLSGIDRLRRERDAVILAHNYQIPPIQDLADFVGDSLQLSRQAASTDNPLIVFCGVHFMAETAAILCPEKRVLLPDPAAGCSLAASVTAEQVREWRTEHPGAAVVAYVNTDADVKAEADYCCTSANAINVVRSIPEDQEVLFLPDLFLGLYVEKMANRRMHLWLGECHVHAGIRSEDVNELMARYPDADLLLHPECGCISQCLFAVSEGELPADRTLVLSTGGMAEHARSCTTPVDLVGTEVGMLHRLRQENPSKRFIPLREDAVCEYMKTITLPKVYRALRDLVYEVRVPADVAGRARAAIDRMVATSA